MFDERDSDGVIPIYIHIEDILWECIKLLSDVWLGPFIDVVGVGSIPPIVVPGGIVAIHGSNWLVTTQTDY